MRKAFRLLPFAMMTIFMVLALMGASPMPTAPASDPMSWLTIPPMLLPVLKLLMPFVMAAVISSLANLLKLHPKVDDKSAKIMRAIVGLLSVIVGILSAYMNGDATAFDVNGALSSLTDAAYLFGLATGWYHLTKPDGYEDRNQGAAA